MAASSGLPEIADQLAAIKCFGIFVRGSALHAADSMHSLKGVFGQPGLVALCLKNVTDILDFAFAQFPFERNEIVGRAQIAVIFGNFVLQNQMVAPGIPGQIRYGAMVLVPVVPVVREDEVRQNNLFEFLEGFLDFCSFVGKEAVAKALDDNLLAVRVLQKEGRAVARLAFALASGTENDPEKLQVAPRGEHLQNGSPAADFNIVGMRPKAQDFEGTVVVALREI